MLITMRKLLQWLPFLLSTSSLHFHSSYADIGTAAKYSPPYLPTECYGMDQTQFPSSNLFAAAGEGIWDNGASCGRQYLVRCISGSEAGTCVAGQTIQIKIVDRTSTAVSKPSVGGTTMALSETAYKAITNPSSSATFINIEFQQLRCDVENRGPGFGCKQIEVVKKEKSLDLFMF